MIKCVSYKNTLFNNPIACLINELLLTSDEDDEAEDEDEDDCKRA